MGAQSIDSWAAAVSPSQSHLVYVAGECPVCPGFMDVYFMACAETGRIFCACPGCGCAWSQPPPSDRLDSIDPPEAFAPGGYGHASEEQLRDADLLSSVHRVDTELEAEHFNGMSGFQGHARS